MFRKPLHRTIAALLGAALLVPAALGQSPAKKTTPARGAAPTVESAAVDRVTRYDSDKRRDPFLNPLLLVKNTNPDEEVDRGAAPPGIAGMYINQVDLVGVSTAPDGKTAVFRGTDKRIYFLHEGDHMFDGYIKGVALDGVQLVRETRLRSGKVLTQEVTKRLRTP